MSKTNYITQLNRATYYTIVCEREIVCVYCQAKLNDANITIDHVLPRSKYNELKRDFKNFAPCCNRCNSSKLDKPLGSWLRDNGYNVRSVKSRIRKAQKQLSEPKIMAKRPEVSKRIKSVGNLSTYKKQLFK